MKVTTTERLLALLGMALLSVGILAKVSDVLLPLGEWAGQLRYLVFPGIFLMLVVVTRVRYRNG